MPQLSRLSVGNGVESRLRRWGSSRYHRIPPLHREFHFPPPSSSFAVSPALSSVFIPDGFDGRRAKPPTRSLRPVIPDNARAPRFTAAAGTRFAGASHRVPSPPRDWKLDRAFRPWLEIGRDIRTSFQLFLVSWGFFPGGPEFTTPFIRRLRPPTRRHVVRLSPIAIDSAPLVPLEDFTSAGTRPLSQCRSGCPGSHPSYPSRAWWAVTPPTT